MTDPEERIVEIEEQNIGPDSSTEEIALWALNRLLAEAEDRKQYHLNRGPFKEGGSAESNRRAGIEAECGLQDQLGFLRELIHHHRLRDTLHREGEDE